MTISTAVGLRLEMNIEYLSPKHPSASGFYIASQKVQDLISKSHNIMASTY